jgi:hypothetical protein
MSSRRRKRRVGPRPTPRAVARAASPGPEAVQRTGRTISWRHCAIGLLAGEALLLLISNLGLLVANVAFGAAGQQHADGGIVGVSTFVAVIFGGWLAARLAGRFGLYQGTVVAIGFIAVGAVWQFVHESLLVAQFISVGSHHLIDLGPMNLGAVVTGDLLALFGGSVGGMLSGKR